MAFELELKFTKERETKNTIRFVETVDDEDNAKVGTLYVSKAALKELGDPESLTVTLEA